MIRATLVIIIYAKEYLLINIYVYKRVKQYEVQVVRPNTYFAFLKNTMKSMNIDAITISSKTAQRSFIESEYPSYRTKTNIIYNLYCVYGLYWSFEKYY